ncbi:MAG: hypothetical protein ISR45_01760 [Rhodospirillales bacterium]|nr:hypothetical protein [Rhodospirillales bacterium]
MDNYKNPEERKRVYGNLRRSSNLVRTQIIPAAVAEGAPSDKIFYKMTKTYFDDDIRSGQLVSSVDLLKTENAENGEVPYVPTMDELARPRTHRCKTAGFETVHPRYLTGLSASFFQAIDSDLPRRQRGEFDLDFLIIANFFLQLAHIAEDGTGRTGEDMLVLLAAQSGRTMTISQTGYRGALEGAGYSLFFRLIANRILYLEVTGNFYKSLGLAVPERASFDINHVVAELARQGSADGNNRQGWPDGLGPIIGKIFKEITDDPGADISIFEPSHPYKFFAEFLACELIYFTLCLRNPARFMPGLKNRYAASVNCCQHNFIASLGRHYQTISDDVGNIADEVIALIEAVRLDWSPRDDNRLNEAVARLESQHPEIGQLFRSELSLFLSEKDKSALEFAIPHGMTGVQLDQQIRACVMKARG